jgi:hypothetical protein
MCRYFFHVVGSDAEFRDESGRSFDKPQDAADQAAKIAAELAQDGDHYWGFVVCVTDADDNELVRVMVKTEA